MHTWSLLFGAHSTVWVGWLSVHPETPSKVGKGSTMATVTSGLGSFISFRRLVTHSYTCVGMRACVEGILLSHGNSKEEVMLTAALTSSKPNFGAVRVTHKAWRTHRTRSVHPS